METLGRYRDNVIVFARHKGGKWAVTVTPRFPSRVFRDGDYVLGKDAWEDTRIIAPAALSEWKEAVTLRSIPGGAEIPLNDILKFFPVALLTDHF